MVYGSLFLICLGLLVLVALLVHIRKTKAIRSWPRIPASLMVAEVLEQHFTGTRAGSARGTTYSLDIIYSYEMDGEKHTSHSIKLSGQAGGSKAWAESELKIIKAIKPFTVAVNPDKPGESYILTRPSIISRMLFAIIGSGLIIGGVVMLVAHWQGQA